MLTDHIYGTLNSDLSLSGDNYIIFSLGRPALPHKGNRSKGTMFALEQMKGQKIVRDYAERRARCQPLYEIPGGSVYNTRYRFAVSSGIILGRLSTPLNTRYKILVQQIKINKFVLKAFLEPQPSIMLTATGQPAFQVYPALNRQFLKRRYPGKLQFSQK